MIKRIFLYTLVSVALFAGTTAGTGRPEAIRWLDYMQGVAQSKATGKAMVIYFYSKNCPSCTEMEKNTWQDSHVMDALNTRYTPIRVNVDKEKQTAAMYKVYYLPTTWFVRPDGTPFGSRSGYIPADLFLKILAYLPK